ncbi:hypothetical protein [Cysteiniphilum halobium]|uniref:hypothetical protein n=1 Tax=Cysteiniphilum halobium TaxID=2219059 RepID=UPI000E6501EB|nr:hypothetical protein [Cysteiniphilum halobium]
MVGFKVLSHIKENEHKVSQYLNRKGRFIIATNQLNEERLNDKMLFAAYKDQQGVERGFRFLKDPWFMVDSFTEKFCNSLLTFPFGYLLERIG